MKYIRNKEKVLSLLKELPTGEVFTTRACKIQAPTRFFDVDLGTIGIQTFVYGLFPIIMDDSTYSVCNVNAMVEIVPDRTLVTQINGTDYYEFFFEPNSQVIKTLNLVQEGTIVYNVFNEFLLMAKIPWYIDYDDLGKLFDTASKYAKSGIGDVPETIEFFSSIVARPVKDRANYIRTALTSYSDASSNNLSFIGLTNVFYAIHSTMNKLAGNYFNDALISALVTPSTETTVVEKILRA